LDPSPDIRDTIGTIAVSAGPPESFVAQVVVALDGAIMKDVLRGEYHGAAQLLLARLVASVGDLLLARDPASARVRATQAAARSYLTAPGEDTWTAYSARATDSYPYGPGDGCYAIADPPTGCDAGTGCPSGAGTLYFAGDEVGFADVASAITAVLAGR
jgi:hypothetical protein